MVSSPKGALGVAWQVFRVPHPYPGPILSSFPDSPSSTFSSNAPQPCSPRSSGQRLTWPLNAHRIEVPASSSVFCTLLFKGLPPPVWVEEAPFPRPIRPPVLRTPFPVVSLATCSLDGNSPVPSASLLLALLSVEKHPTDVAVRKEPSVNSLSCRTVACLLPALCLQHFLSSRVLPPHRHSSLHPQLPGSHP